MHTTTHKARAFMTGIALILLAACSQFQEPNLSQDFSQESHDYIATLTIDSTTQRADLARQHKADVILFEPDLGFAVLAFNKEEAELSSLSLQANFSQFGFSKPKAIDFGFGLDTWVEAWKVWTGGKNTRLIAANNSATFNTINLTEGQNLSKNQGEGVTVAVIDTGIDLNHPMFKGRLAPAGTWRDYVDNDGYPQEEKGLAYGHGTGVAGIILQIAPKAKILPIRTVTANGTGTLTDTISAIVYAATNGADIINLSLGSNDLGNALYLASYVSARYGVRLVSSVGNTGNTNITAPAKYAGSSDLGTNLLGIASLDKQRRPSSFSSYGAAVSAAMPGEHITSAYPNNQMAQFSGTSFATPLYAGALALAYAETKHYNYASLDGLNATYAVHGPDKTWQVLDVAKLVKHAQAK